MVHTVNGHADVMKDASQDYHNLSMIPGKLKIFCDGHFHPVFFKYSHEPEGNIGHNLKMHRPMVAHAHALYCIDIENIPDGEDFFVGIYSLESFAKECIVFQRYMNHTGYDITMSMKKHQYISVMGTIGSGKTTAARLIAKELKFQLVEENFGENAFLPRFYEDMKRWAFHSQTFFLMEKITQMLDTPIEQDVFSYAKAQHVLGHIDDAEWRLYQKIYISFTPSFPKPDCIVFLDTSIETIMNRIEKRGRGFEKKIPQSYLELLDMLNRKWLAEVKKSSVLTIRTDGLNIVTSKIAQRELLRRVKAKAW